MNGITSLVACDNAMYSASAVESAISDCSFEHQYNINRTKGFGRGENTRPPAVYFARGQNPRFYFIVLARGQVPIKLDFYRLSIQSKY